MATNSLLMNTEEAMNPMNSLSKLRTMAPSPLTTSPLPLSPTGVSQHYHQQVLSPLGGSYSSSGSSGHYQQQVLSPLGRGSIGSSSNGSSSSGIMSIPSSPPTLLNFATSSSSSIGAASGGSSSSSSSSSASSSSGTIAGSSSSARRLSGGGHENFSPQVIQRIAREVQDLINRPPEGITFVPNDEETLMEIHADLIGPAGTPYEEGVFRMRLVLSRDYPHSPPRAFFLSKIYHPNVATNGDICVNMLKRDWNANLTIAHVLQVIRCLLIVPFPESSLNDEAGKLFMESYDEYARRARLLTAVHAVALIPSSYTGDRKMPASSACSASTITSGTTQDDSAVPTKVQRDRTKEKRRKSLQRL